MKKVSLILISFLSLSFLFGTVYADKVLKFKVDSVVDGLSAYEVEPGGFFDADALLIINDNDYSSEFILYYEPSEKDGYEGLPAYWIKMDEAKFVLDANSSKIIPWSVNVPEDAVEAKYIGIFRLEENVETEEKLDGGVVTRLTAGRQVFVTVKKEVLDDDVEASQGDDIDVVDEEEVDLSDESDESSSTFLDSLYDNLGFVIIALIFALLVGNLFMYRKKEKK